MIKVTKSLKGHHFKIFGKVAKKIKHAGIGGRRLFCLIIKYLPEYLFFFRHMKIVVVMRLLRQIRHYYRLINTISTNTILKEDDDTASTVFSEEDEIWLEEENRYIL